MKKLLPILLFLGVTPAAAQNILCPTRPLGDQSNACASTAFVSSMILNTPLSGMVTGPLNNTTFTGGAVVTALGYQPVNKSGDSNLGNLSATNGGWQSNTNGSTAYQIHPFWAYYPSYDLIHYSNAISQTTGPDTGKWESPLGIDYLVTQGWRANWTAGATVNTGDTIQATPTGAPAQYVYLVTTGGTLGSSLPTGGPGAGPETNGTATLQWVNFTQISAKLSFTNTVRAQGNAGSIWGENFNTQLQPLNHMPTLETGMEHDFTNNSGYDCGLFSGATCDGINLYMGGTNQSTVGFNISTPGNNGPKYATSWGMWIAGKYLSQDAAIEINTGGTTGIGIGRYGTTFTGMSYTQASVRDEATAPYSYSAGGTYSSAAFDSQNATLSPYGGFGVAFVMSGNQQVCWAGFNVCIRFDTASSKFMMRWSGSDVYSLDSNGNARFHGTVTASTTP